MHCASRCGELGCKVRGYVGLLDFRKRCFELRQLKQQPRKWHDCGFWGPVLSGQPAARVVPQHCGQVLCLRGRGSVFYILLYIYVYILYIYIRITYYYMLYASYEICLFFLGHGGSSDHSRTCIRLVGSSPC